MAADPPIEGAIRVTVLRHGEVAGRPHVYRGMLDDPLAPAGLARMRVVAEWLANPPFDRVASSPLARCADFARIFCAERGLPLDLLPAFAELDFGAWEGLSPDQAAQRDPEAYSHFRQSAGRVAPPGGESVDRLRRRVSQGWHDWLGEFDRPKTDQGVAGGHRLLVTHAGVMRALLMELIGLPIDHIYRIALPEAAHFTVSILPGAAPVLLAINSCAD